MKTLYQEKADPFFIIYLAMPKNYYEVIPNASTL